MNQSSIRIRRVGRSAFTLVELLLVMVIIAILAGIVVPKLLGRREQANKTRAIADIAAIKQAITTFEVDNGRLPTQSEGLQALVSNPGNLPEWHSAFDALPVDPWSRPYVYHNPGTNGKDFDIYCTGPSGQDGNADNITGN